MISTWILVVVCGATLLSAISRKEYAVSYQLLLSATMAYFIIPGLLAHSYANLLEPWEIEQTALYATLCLLMGHAGWLRPSKFLKSKIYSGKVDSSVAKIYLFIAVLIGGFCSYKVSALVEDMNAARVWSGPETIYYRFALLIWYSLPVSLFMYFRTRQKVFAVFALIPLLFVVPSTILAGRRDEIIELAIIGLLVIRYFFGRYPPRLLILGGGLAAALLFSGIHTYRSTSRDEGIIAASKKAIEQTFNTEGERDTDLKYREVARLIIGMSHASDQLIPNFGAVYWNRFIHSHVPAQIVGSDLKNALQIDSVAYDESLVSGRGLHVVQGSTSTGLWDTFASFSWFGSLLFFLTGSFLRTVHDKMEEGSEPARFAYPALLVSGGVGLTHSMFYVFLVLINVFMFQYVWFILRLRREPERRDSRVRAFQASHDPSREECRSTFSE